MESLNYTKATGKGKEKEQNKHNLSQAQSSESKVISAILTGVNLRELLMGTLRKCNYCHYGLDTHIDTLFRISHSPTFDVSIQALVLMQ